MDADEIRTLLGDNIFERAKKYRKRIQQSTCTCLLYTSDAADE